MSSSPKKVIVRTVTGSTFPGYLPHSNLIHSVPDAPEKACVDLLDLSGRITPIPLATIAMISFVRDFNVTDTVNPERLGRRAFLSRPRTEGLWLRITFSSGVQLEGLASPDLSLLSSAFTEQGIYLVPPDVRSNTQRVFVPINAIAALQLLAVITNPSKAAPPPRLTQGQLFASTNTRNDE